MGVQSNCEAREGWGSRRRPWNSDTRRSQKVRDCICCAQQWACGEHSVSMGQVSAGMSEHVSKCKCFHFRVLQHSWVGRPHSQSKVREGFLGGGYFLGRSHMTEDHVYGEVWPKVKKPLEYFFRSIFNPLLGTDTWVHRNTKCLCRILIFLY